jgi:hypothetical protein
LAGSSAGICCRYFKRIAASGITRIGSSKPDFCQPEDLFIHGIVADQGKGGTCASMPVVYVSVARRLGLPVHLVEARGHLFFRWEDHRGTLIDWTCPDVRLWIPPDRFNIEGSGEGIAYYPDSHYIQWPELWTETDFAHGRYLRSMTARENLAAFLIQRAECFYDLGNIQEALKAIYYARQLEPDDLRYQWLHAKRSKEYHDRSLRLPDPAVHRPARRRLPGAHPPHCQCFDCRQAGSKPAQRFLPSHGDSCECWNCRTERESQTNRSRAPGHPPGCLCPLCQPMHANPHHQFLEGV